MFKDSYNYVKVKNGKVNQFTIRPVREEDINQVAIARIAQENENGNGSTKEYIEEYKKGVLNLLNTNRLIGAGAFLGDNIVSIALPISRAEVGETFIAAFPAISLHAVVFEVNTGHPVDVASSMGNPKPSPWLTK